MTIKPETKICVQTEKSEGQTERLRTDGQHQNNIPPTSFGGG